MNRRDRFFAFIKCPPLWFLCLWYVLTAALIVLSIFIVTLSTDGWWTAAVYALAALSLAYTVFTIIYAAPKAKKTIVAWLRKNRAADKFISDYALRTIVFDTISFVINTAYVIVNGVTAIRYLSVWYACMTAYYLALGLVRGGVLLAGKRAVTRYGENGADLLRAKHKIYLGCGISLLVLEIALALAVTQMVLDDSHAQTGMILAIAVAAYTFYKFTLAIVNIVRARKFRDPAVQCLRNINLVEALVSMLSLEITLITATGGGGSEMQTMNAIMGAAVCITSIVMSVVMIVQAVKALRRNESE